MYTLTCKLCGKSFESSFKDIKICKECKNRPCEVCGKIFTRVWPYDQRVCSPECRHILRNDRTNIEQKEAKRKKTVQEKYSVDNVSQLREVQLKIAKSHQSGEYKEKVRKTSLEKYGVEDYRRSPEIIEKRRNTMIERYEVDNASKVDSFRQKISERLKDPMEQYVLDLLTTTFYISTNKFLLIY